MKDVKIVCMGDSLTEGYEINPAKRWSDLLSRKMGIEFINSGISGDTTGGMLARFQPMVVAHQPTHVIIMGGTNDLWINLPDELILSNILAMTRQANYHEIIPIIGIPTPYFFEDSPLAESIFITDRKLSDRIDIFCEKLRQFAREDEHPVIDFSVNMTRELFQEDGVYPNEKGQEVMAEQALIALKNIF